MATTDLEQALYCLTKVSSFVAFEQLDGISSHLSRVYHSICIGTPFALVSAWLPDKSTEENTERTGRLLLDLRDNSYRPIQLAGHLELATDESASAVERALFVTYNWTDCEKSKRLMLSLCDKYEQRAVAIYANNQIRVLDAFGDVHKTFTRALIEPRHLKRIWSAMTARNFVQVDTGYLHGSPLQFCGPIYDHVGITSDIPISQLSRLSYTAGELVNRQPFRNRQEMEREQLRDTMLTSEILAGSLIRSGESGNVVKEKRCYEQLVTFCTANSLNVNLLIEHAARKHAGVLAVDVLRADKKGDPARKLKCYERLIAFCAKHHLNTEQVIYSKKHIQGQLG